MKPIIGITIDMGEEGKQFIKKEYVRAIIRAGGLPFLIPSGIEEDAVQVTDRIDGLLLTGGDDINPLLFDEEPHPGLGKVTPERDTTELVLARLMLACDKPILGICRGLQLLNVAFGGTVYQDIYHQHEGPLLQHRQQAPHHHPSHYVQLEKGGILEEIAGCDRILVNSFHHQAVKDVPAPLMVTGVASDQIIEAIESTDHQFVLAVQWHPELLAANGDAVSLRIFEQFIQNCTTIKS